jgi:hypothetical protein
VTRCVVPRVAAQELGRWPRDQLGMQHTQYPARLSPRGLGVIGCDVGAGSGLLLNPAQVRDRGFF